MTANDDTTLFHVYTATEIDTLRPMATMPTGEAGLIVYCMLL
jgi:hypothetical protein